MMSGILAGNEQSKFAEYENVFKKSTFNKI
jgi:hypothetical protein